MIKRDSPFSVKHAFLILFLLGFLSFLGAEDLFVAPLGETLGYGWNGIAYGGGLALGTGSGGALGLRFLYLVDREDIVFFEVNVFARLYIFGPGAFSGPFVQINAGPVLYSDQSLSPSGYGNVSAGLSGGWRFLLGRFFFLEPSLRIGYPYLAGGGVAAGYRINRPHGGNR